MYARMINRSYSSAWIEVATQLRGRAAAERERRNWIVNLASDRRVFRFDENDVLSDARTQFDRFRGALARDEAYRDFRFRAADHDGALQEMCNFIYDWASTVILRGMQQGR